MKETREGAGGGRGGGPLQQGVSPGWALVRRLSLGGVYVGGLAPPRLFAARGADRDDTEPRWLQLP